MCWSCSLCLARGFRFAHNSNTCPSSLYRNQSSLHPIEDQGVCRHLRCREFQGRLDRVNELESEADILRRDIEKQLYSNTLIPDSRGDVLGLIETVDQLMSEFEGSLWAFSIETPDIPEDYVNGYRKLTNMVIRAVDELALGARAFFRSPHDVPAYNHKVVLYEKEADVISTNLKRAIFDSDLDLAQKIHLREFVEQIDNIADVAEDVADRLSIYAIKRIV